MRCTEGRGVDVAIEALGTQQTFESCLRVLKAGGVLSSLGVYAGKLSLPMGCSPWGATVVHGERSRLRRSGYDAARAVERDVARSAAALGVDRPWGTTESRSYAQTGHASPYCSTGSGGPGSTGGRST